MRNSTGKYGKRWRPDCAGAKEQTLTRIALDALGGQQLAVEITGEGQAIVAIHGFTGNASTWAAFCKAARSEYAIVCPDMPGHGASDSPNNPQIYDMEHSVRSLEELLVRLKLQRVHWLGYSMGGRIALAAAIALPERTASLTLESASPGLASAEERAARAGFRTDQASPRLR